MFEIRGQGGRIITRSLFMWSFGWTRVPLPAVALAKNAAEIEGSLALSPTTNHTRMVFATTDWSGIGDITPPANATVQSPAPPLAGSGVTVEAPEFRDILLPVAGTFLIAFVVIRRRRAAP